MHPKILDRKFTFSTSYVSPAEHAELYRNLMNSFGSHSVHDFRQLSRFCQTQEDRGFLTINFQIVEDSEFRAKLEKKFRKGYKLFCTLEISTRVSNPQGPVFFHTDGETNYFIKNSGFHSARNLFPCVDTLG